MSKAIQDGEVKALIAAERKRQIEVEGWTPEHDDQHRDGEMLRAAVYYLHHGSENCPLSYDADGIPIGWPWEKEWWKPKDRRSNLIRAGALCLAEKDRLRRTGRKDLSHVDHKLNLVINALERLTPPTQRET